MRSIKPDFCFLVVEGDTKPNIRQTDFPTKYIRTPTGWYVYFEHTPYSLDVQQMIANRYNGDSTIRRIVDYTTPKQIIFWEYRRQPLVRLSLICMVAVVEDNEFIVHLDGDRYLILTFPSHKSALAARKDLLNACVNSRP